MSERYKLSRECPECGLTVAYSETRGYRPHAKQAAEAGKVGTSCAQGLRTVREKAERAEAKGYEQASRPMRDEFWKARDKEPQLPRHLR